MKFKWKLLHVAAPALALLAIGCGGGGDSGSSTPSAPSNTTISNSTAAKDAAAGGTQSATLLSSGMTSLSGVASGTGLAPGLAQMTARPLAKQDVRASKLSEAQARLMKRVAPRIAAARKAAGTRIPYSLTPDPCGVSGDVTITGDTGFNTDYTAVTGPFTMKFTYNNCRELENSTTGFETNGSFEIVIPLNTTGEPTGSITITFGNGDGSLDGSDLTDSMYSVSAGTWSTSPVAVWTAGMTFSGSYTDSSTGCDQYGLNCTLSRSGTHTFSANGGQSFVLGNDSWELAFNNLSASGTFSRTRGIDDNLFTDDDAFSWDDTANGGLSQTHKTNGNVVHSAAISYYNFRLRETAVSNTGTWRIDGTVTTDFTPNACFEGTFTFVTNTPVAWDASDLFTAGSITINGNVTLTFSNNGTANVITVTFSGTSEDLTESQLEALCPIQGDMMM
jgi:hypothetical protein